MAKTSSNGSGTFSPFQLPNFPFNLASFPQVRMNGGLPATALLEFARSQAKVASKCSSEIGRFIEQRVDRDEQLLTEMAKCKDLGSLAELQAAWASEALKEYMQESGQIMELLRSAYSEALAPKKTKQETEPL